jgi:hypothetical protein
MIESPPSLANGIPKVVHQIWLGGGELPERHARAVRTVGDCHPAADGWSHHVWGEAKAAELIPWAHDFCTIARANLLRYALMETCGGVYFDCDIELHRAIAPALPAGCVAYADADWGLPNQCFLASPPGHPFWAALAQNYTLAAQDERRKSPLLQTEIVGYKRFGAAVAAWARGWRWVAGIYTATGHRIGSRWAGDMAQLDREVLQLVRWDPRMKDDGPWRDRIRELAVAHPVAHGIHWGVGEWI